MKTLFRLLLCLFFNAALHISVYGQTAPGYESIVHNLFPEDGPGGVVLVAKGGQIVYNGAFGKANLELDVPMRTDHVFRLGSVTKQFTAVCILQLAEENRLSLDDELVKFIPDYLVHGKKITIANLLSHTAGIKNYTGLPAFNENLKRQDLGPQELIAMFKDEPLDFEPGSKNQYSNSGYILLGYIIEKLSGKSYGEYVQEQIFKPLGMTHSYYDEQALIVPGRIPGYRKRNGRYENSAYLSMSLPYAAGSLMSTTGDLLKWYTALAAGKIISKASLEKAQTSWILPNGRETGYGFGWETGNIQGSKAVKHNGVVNGFFTDVVYLPGEQILVCILSNDEQAGDLDIPAAKLAAIALDKPYIFTEISLKPDMLRQYQGVYGNSYEGERCISWQEGGLMYYSKGGGKTRLVPIGQDTFLLENSLNTLHFQRNGKTAVSGYGLQGTGTASEWKRTGDMPFRKPLDLPEKTLSTYTGKYLFGAGMLFEVLLEKNKLFGRVGQDQKELVPFAKDQFYARDLDATLIFQQDKTGRVTGVTKIQNSEMSAKKTE